MEGAEVIPLKCGNLLFKKVLTSFFFIDPASPSPVLSHRRWCVEIVSGPKFLFEGMRLCMPLFSGGRAMLFPLLSKYFSQKHFQNVSLAREQWFLGCSGGTFLMTQKRIRCRETLLSSCDSDVISLLSSTPLFLNQSVF